MSTVEEILKSTPVDDDDIGPEIVGSEFTPTSVNDCTNIHSNDVNYGEVYNISIDRIRVLFPSLNRGQKSLLLTAVREEQNLKNKLRELQLESGELDYGCTNDMKNGNTSTGGKFINILSPDSGKLTPPWVIDEGREKDDNVTTTTLNNGELLGFVMAQLSHSILAFYAEKDGTVRGSIEGEWSGGVRGDGKVQLEQCDGDQSMLLGRFTLVLKDRPTKRQRQKCCAAKNDDANKERIVNRDTLGVKKVQVTDGEDDTVPVENTVSSDVIKRKKRDYTIECKKDDIPRWRSTHPAGESTIDTTHGVTPLIVFSDEMMAVAAVVVLGKHDHYVTSHRESTELRTIKRIATTEQLARIMAGDKKRQLEQQSRKLPSPNGDGSISTNVFIDFQQRHQQEIHIRQQCHHQRINQTSAMYVAMNSVLLAPKTKFNILSQNDLPLTMSNNRISKLEDGITNGVSMSRSQEWAFRHRHIDTSIPGCNIGYWDRRINTKDVGVDLYNRFPRWHTSQHCYFYEGHSYFHHHHHHQHHLHSSLQVPMSSNGYPLPPYGTGPQDFFNQPYLKATASPFASYSVGSRGRTHNNRNMSCDSSANILRGNNSSANILPVSQIWGCDPVAYVDPTIKNNTDADIVNNTIAKNGNIISVSSLDNTTLSTGDLGMIGMYNGLWGAPTGVSLGFGASLPQSEQEELEELKAVLSSLLQEGLDLNQMEDEEKSLSDALLSAEGVLMPAVTMVPADESKSEQNFVGDVGDGISVASSRATVGSHIVGISEIFTSTPNSPSSTTSESTDDYNWSSVDTCTVHTSDQSSTSYLDTSFVSDMNCFYGGKLPEVFLGEAAGSDGNPSCSSTHHNAIVLHEKRCRAISATGKALKKLFMSLVRGKRTVLRLKRSGDSLFADVVSTSQLSHYASQRLMMQKLMETLYQSAYSQQKMIGPPTVNVGNVVYDGVGTNSAEEGNINSDKHNSNATGMNGRFYGSTQVGEQNIFHSIVNCVGECISDIRMDDNEEEERILLRRALHTANRTLIKQFDEGRTCDVGPCSDSSSADGTSKVPRVTTGVSTFPIRQKVQFALSGFDLVLQCDDMPILELNGKSGGGQRVLLHMEELQENLTEDISANNNSDIVHTSHGEMGDGTDEGRSVVHSSDSGMCDGLKHAQYLPPGNLRNKHSSNVTASDKSLSISEVLALERWFDAALAKTPYVGVCVHKNGIIRNVDMKRTSELLNEMPGVAAKALEAMDITSDLLKWLVVHCTNESSEYFLVRDGDNNDEVVHQIIEERKVNTQRESGELCIEKDIYYRRGNHYMYHGKEGSSTYVSHEGAALFSFGDTHTPTMVGAMTTTQTVCKTAIKDSDIKNWPSHNIVNDFKLFEIPRG